MFANSTGSAVRVEPAQTERNPLRIATLDSSPKVGPERFQVTLRDDQVVQPGVYRLAVRLVESPSEPVIIPVLIRKRGRS